MPTASAHPAVEFDRNVSLDRLADETFDILVIGGGITGVGVALDAAARGLRTALVEGRDFASGTSSRSSKMVHGGLRYLQHGDLGLVCQSLRERQRLLENAPHLVTPLPFLLPLIGKTDMVHRGVAQAFSSALALYDLAGGGRCGPRHRRIGHTEAQELFPAMSTDHLIAAFLYSDAWVDDARLTLTVARTAAWHGAVVANYCPVTSLICDNRGRIRGARVNPAIPEVGPSTGARSSPNGDLEILATVVVSASGVWANHVSAMEHPDSSEVLGEARQSGAAPHIRPAKGVHLTVPRSRLPTNVAAVIPVAADKRNVFAVPWGDGDDVYIGTTDTAWEGSLDDPECTPEDVEYLLSAINRITSSHLVRADVTGTWAGLRPLVASYRGEQTSKNTADLSRHHSVTVSAEGMVTVTGGKLTTYRLMAEETVDKVVEILDRAAPTGSQRCPTRRLPLIGSAGTSLMRRPGAWQRIAVEAVSASNTPPAADSGRRRTSGGSADGFDGSASRPGAALDEHTVEALISRHGGEVEQVISLAEGRPDLLRPLVPGLPALAVEALWAARHEMAVTIDDVLSRRVRATPRRAEASCLAAHAVAQILASEWGRDRDAVDREAAAFGSNLRAQLERAGIPLKAKHGLTGDPLSVSGVTPTSNPS